VKGGASEQGAWPGAAGRVLLCSRKAGLDTDSPGALSGSGPQACQVLGRTGWEDIAGKPAAPRPVQKAPKTANKIGRVGGAYLPSCSGDRWEDDLSSGQPGQYRETRLLKNFLK
jgi:hypothetical protein